MQIGFAVSAWLAGQDMTGKFDMTGDSIVPAPSVLALLAMGALVNRRRR
jgi:hypothetical protein